MVKQNGGSIVGGIYALAKAIFQRRRVVLTHTVLIIIQKIAAGCHGERDDGPSNKADFLSGIIWDE